MPGRVSIRERAEAQRMLNEILAIERKAVHIARKITVQLRKEALRAFKNGSALNVRNLLSGDLITLLEKTMEVAALAGMRRAILQTQGQALQLDQLDDQLATLRRLVQEHYANKLGYLPQSLSSRVIASAVELVRGVTADTQRQLREKVSELINERSSVRHATEELNTTFQQLGLSGSEWRLETIFRTQTQLAYNGAQYRASQAPAVQEILWGYKYITVGDDRVRPEHEAWDGVCLPKEDPFWNTHWPPNGWNCRCAVIPMYESRPIVFPRDQQAQVDPDFAYNPGLL